MPTRFASSIDGAPILAARAYADQYGLNIDQYYAKKTELFSGDYNDLTNKPDLSVYALASSVPTKTSDLTNDSGFITLNDVPTQVQSDWNETDTTDPAYIQHKPDLSVYALSSSLATVATSGDYNDLTNKPTIPAAQVNSDWNAVSGVAQILNKPDLSVYALASSLATVATSGDYNDLTNKPSIPAAQVQSDYAQNDSSAVDYIRNKPDLSVYALSSSLATVATSGDYNDLSNKPTIPAAQVNSDWNAVSGVAQILNKPDLSVYALASSLATVATSGDYDDLINKPTIPAAQVNSDWNAVSGVAQILNKPDLSVYALATDLPTFVEGQNVHISTSGNQVTISADDTTYTAGDGIDINNGVISVDTDDVKIDYWHGGSNSALASGTDLNANVSATAYRGTNIYVSGGAITLKPGTYAVNAFVKVNNTNTTLDDDAYKLSFSGGITGGNPTIAYNFDNSFRHEEVVEVSFLTVNLGSTDAALVLTTDALSVLAGVSVTLTYAQVYCLSGIVGSSGSGGGGAANITLSSTDHSVTITENTIGDTTNFDLSVPAQVNADWNSSSGKSQILNKPDLSVYALSANLATVATSGSYNDLSNKPTIPAAPVQSNWTESNSSSLAYILNKPDLTAYALKSELATVATSGSYTDLSNKPDLSVYVQASSLATVATTGDYDDLVNKPTIPAAQVQSDWTEADNTDPSYIQNKPAQLSLVAGTNVTLVEDSVNNTLTISSTGGGGGGSQVQANWAETDTSDPSYIQNKPDLSVYALSSSLATVATSGSYNDLSNKPDLSVYALSANLATVATSGSYTDLSNKPADAPSDGKEYVRKNGAWVESSGAVETVLFDGGSTGANDCSIYANSLVLSEAATNFDRVKILYQNNDGYAGSVDFDPATSTKVQMATITPLSNGNTYQKAATIETTDGITWTLVGGPNHWRYKSSNGSGESWSAAGANIYIHKVIGLKYGVNLYNINNNETVLFNGGSSGSNAASITLSESPSNFEKIMIVINDVYGYGSAATVNQIIMTPSESRYSYNASYIFSTGTEVVTRGCSIRASANMATSWDTNFWAVGITTSGGITCSVNASQIRLMKIIGINRITNAS